jgi:hypothetical protein
MDKCIIFEFNSQERARHVLLRELIGGLNQLLARTRKSGAVVSKEAPQVVADTGRMADVGQGVFQRCDQNAALRRLCCSFWAAGVDHAEGSEKQLQRKKPVAHPHESLQQWPHEVGSGSGRKLWS